MATLYNQPTNNNLQYTLNSAIGAGDSSLVLSSSVAGVVQFPGVLVIDRVDSAGNKTPSSREYISFTGVSGANLTGLSRGLGGSTGVAHNVGAIVEFVADVVWANAVYNVITQEHGTTGQHLSLASVSFISTLALVNLSTASIRNIVGNTLDIGGLFSASLASFRKIVVADLSGVFPSAASGQILTSNGSTGAPVYAASPAASTGGLNAVLQIPGGLASLANIGGMITIPTAFTAQFVQGYVQTPASVASISVVIKKNLLTVFAVGTIPAGATFFSSASIANAALVAGDQLTMDINSTASLATDLSVLLRAT